MIEAEVEDNIASLLAQEAVPAGASFANPTMQASQIEKFSLDEIPEKLFKYDPTLNNLPMSSVRPSISTTSTSSINIFNTSSHVSLSEIGGLTQRSPRTLSNSTDSFQGADDQMSDKQTSSNTKSNFRSSAAFGHKTFLNNINYISEGNKFLMQKNNHSLSPKDIESSPEDYLNVNPYSIPGYTLIKQFASRFEQSDVFYHAVRTEEPLDPKVGTATLIHPNSIQLEPGTKVVVRLSPDFAKNSPFSRFLNEWYLLSGKGSVDFHRFGANLNTSNKYLDPERTQKMPTPTRYTKSPVTLPTDIPGILYPVKVLTINTIKDNSFLHSELNDNDPDLDPDLYGLRDDDDLSTLHRWQGLPSRKANLSGSSTPAGASRRSTPGAFKRFALVYIDKEYVTMKESSQEDKSVTTDQNDQFSNSGSSANSANSAQSMHKWYVNGSHTSEQAASSDMPSLFDIPDNYTPKSPLKVIEILSDIIKVLETLAVVHELGVVHNGITSYSILKSANDYNDVKLAGWDFAFSIQPEDSTIDFRSSKLIHFPELLPYLSPEVSAEVNRGVNYLSDMYAIGVVLYESLLGCLPFQSSNPAKMVQQHLNQTPIAPKLVSRGFISDFLSGIVMKLLQKQPSLRYRDCHSLINDLIVAKNTYIEQISGLGQRRLTHSNELLQHYLEKEPPRNVNKCGVPPNFTYEMAFVGRDEEYKQAFAQASSQVDGIYFTLITGKTGSGKTMLLEDIRSSIMFSNGFHTRWKFSLNKRSMSVYTSFLHGMKLIVNQILAFSSEVIAKWRDLVISRIPVDLSVLFGIIPELLTFLGPTYTTLKQHKESIAYTQDDPSINLDLKFRYIIKSFYCLMGLHGLTVFYDDIQWCSEAEWAMISECLDYFQANDLEKKSCVKTFATYNTEVRANSCVVSREQIQFFLSDKGTNYTNVHLGELSLFDFAQYFRYNFKANAVSNANNSVGGSNSGHNATPIGGNGQASEDEDKILSTFNESFRSAIKAIHHNTKGSILYGHFIIVLAVLTGKGKVDGDKWILDFKNVSNIKYDQIIKAFLDKTLSDDARMLLKFAAMITVGSHFYLSDLMVVSGWSISKVFILLHQAANSIIIDFGSTFCKIPFHLITTDEFPFALSDSNIWSLASQTKYKFHSDSIQTELLDELKADNELKKFHRMCGLRFYKRLSKLNNFGISDYLQMASHFCSSIDVAKEDEYEIYRKVLVQGGRYASSICNLPVALELFMSVHKFIDPSEKELRLKTVLTICQTQYQLKQYDECLAYISESQKRYDFDETVFLLPKVRCLTQAGRHKEGVKTAVEGLKRIGIVVSSETEDSDTTKAIGEVALSAAEIRGLRSAKQTKKPVILLIYELISDIMIPCYMLGYDNMRKNLTVQLLHMLQTHGVSYLCAIPILDFANNLARTNDRGQFMKAVEYTKLALYLVESAENVSISVKSKVYEFYVATLGIYVKPLSDVLKYCEIYAEPIRPFAGHGPGKPNFTMDVSKILVRHYAGSPSEILISGKFGHDIYSQVPINRDNIVVGYLRLMNDEITLKQFEGWAPEGISVTRGYMLVYYTGKIRYFIAQAKFIDAFELICKTFNQIFEVYPNIVIHLEYYFACVVVLTKCTYDTEEDKLKGKTMLTKIMGYYELWAERNPSTFKSKFLIMSALALTLDHKASPLHVLDMFEESVEYAREVNNFHEVAWGCLYCVDWLLIQGKRSKRVSQFVKTAIDIGKASEGQLFFSVVKSRYTKYLEDNFSWAGVPSFEKLVKRVSVQGGSEESPLFRAAAPVTSSDLTFLRTSDKVTKASASPMRGVDSEDALSDLNKAVKTCLSISESFEDRTIVMKLMESTIMFSGVEYGVVIIHNNEEEPLIQAIGTSHNVYSLPDQPLSATTAICPNSLIKYVLLTGEIVNKDEDPVMFSNKFGTDDYFLHKDYSDVITIPLKNQTGVFGALYLENQKPSSNKQDKPFNATKRDLLHLLCTQAAVSIGKAKLYSQMEVAKKAAEDATAEKASFLANMSHEIRTPFNSLLSCSIFLLDTELTTTQREYVETVRTSAMVTLNIIDGILAFSKIEHGSFTLDNAPFSLCECIESSIQLSGEQAAMNDLELVFFNRCQSINHIFGDVTRFRQILINLIGNASKFTSSGSIIVETIAREVTSSRFEIQILVKDTGIGIPEDANNKVFGAFSQVDGSSRRAFGGSGLGLAISKKLADIMGGSLSFDSQEGIGSTFKFVLTSEVKLYDRPDFYFGIEESQKVSIPNKALIIDSHKLSRQSLLESMEYFGFEVTTTNSLQGLQNKIDEYSIVFVHDSEYGLFRENKGKLIKGCKIIVLAQFGKSLPSNLDNHAVLLLPFQRQKLIDLISDIATSHDNDVNKISKKLKEAAIGKITKEKLATTYPLRILLAEDNPINTRVALQHLRKFGYEADNVKDGVEVLEKCEELLLVGDSYDVILMDIQMPRKDGIAATIELRQLYESASCVDKQPKVVALTANVAGDDRERSLKCGMVDFVSKPIIPSDLERVLINIGKELYEALP